VVAYDSELDDVVLPWGTEFCIKAGPGNTGVRNTSDFGVGMTLFEILEYIGFVNPVARPERQLLRHLRVRLVQLPLSGVAASFRTRERGVSGYRTAHPLRVAP